MSDDNLESTVPSTGNDDKLKPNPSPSPSLSTTPPSSSTPQITLTKFGSLTNRILSPSNINSSPLSTNSSSPTHISPIKSSSCNSSTRRTFNICDILAKPSSSSSSSSSVDNNNNTRLHHLIKKPKPHRFTDYTKLILEQKSNHLSDSHISSKKKSVYPHSDNDDDEDDDPGSISDCDVSGKLYLDGFSNFSCLWFRWLFIRSRW